MSFKLAESAFKKAESAFQDVLISEIERLAKLVIETHEDAKSFCMGMGSASFNCVWVEDEDGDPFKCDDYKDPHDLKDVNSHAADLSNLFDEWGSKFCLYGHAMKITRDNVTNELITKTDW